MKKILYILISVSMLLVGCGSNRTSFLQEEGDTIPMLYAKNITMVRYGDCVKVDLVNPWGKGLLGSYMLIPSDAPNCQLSTVNSQLFPAHCFLLSFSSSRGLRK